MLLYVWNSIGFKYFCIAFPILYGMIYQMIISCDSFNNINVLYPDDKYMSTNVNYYNDELLQSLLLNLYT